MTTKMKTMLIGGIALLVISIGGAAVLGTDEFLALLSGVSEAIQEQVE